MKRTFKKGRLRINREIYEIFADIDVSILEGKTVEIEINPYPGRGIYYKPTEDERKLLGSKAKYILLKRCQND